MRLFCPCIHALEKARKKRKQIPCESTSNEYQAKLSIQRKKCSGKRDQVGRLPFWKWLTAVTVAVCKGRPAFEFGEAKEVRRPLRRRCFAERTGEDVMAAWRGKRKKRATLVARRCPEGSTKYCQPVLDLVTRETGGGVCGTTELRPEVVCEECDRG